jgi:hypothetical protein
VLFRSQQQAVNDWKSQQPQEVQDWIDKNGVDDFNKWLDKTNDPATSGEDSFAIMKGLGYIAADAVYKTRKDDGSFEYYTPPPSVKTAKVVDLNNIDYSNLLDEQDYYDIALTASQDPKYAVSSPERLPSGKPTPNLDYSFGRFAASQTGDNKAALNKLAQQIIQNRNADQLAIVFPPAKALRTDVTFKDISGVDWVVGAAQVMAIIVSPALGALGKTAGAVGKVASIAGKVVDVGVVGSFGAVTAMEWPTMSTSDKMINVAMNVGIVGALYGKSLFRGIKAIAGKLNEGEAATVLKISNQIAKMTKSVEAGNVSGIKSSAKGLIESSDKLASTRPVVARTIKEQAETILKNASQLAKGKIALANEDFRALSSIENKVIVSTKVGDVYGKLANAAVSGKATATDIKILAADLKKLGRITASKAEGAAIIKDAEFFSKEAKTIKALRGDIAKGDIVPGSKEIYAKIKKAVTESRERAPIDVSIVGKPEVMTTARPQAKAIKLIREQLRLHPVKYKLPGKLWGITNLDDYAARLYDSIGTMIKTNGWKAALDTYGKSMVKAISKDALKYAEAEAKFSKSQAAWSISLEAGNKNMQASMFKEVINEGGIPYNVPSTYKLKNGMTAKEAINEIANLESPTLETVYGGSAIKITPKSMSGLKMNYPMYVSPSFLEKVVDVQKGLIRGYGEEAGGIGKAYLKTGKNWNVESGGSVKQIMREIKPQIVSADEFGHRISLSPSQISQYNDLYVDIGIPSRWKPNMKPAKLYKGYGEGTETSFYGTKTELQNIKVAGNSLKEIATNLRKEIVDYADKNGFRATLARYGEGITQAVYPGAIEMAIRESEAGGFSAPGSGQGQTINPQSGAPSGGSSTVMAQNITNATQVIAQTNKVWGATTATIAQSPKNELAYIPQNIGAIPAAVLETGKLSDITAKQAKANSASMAAAMPAIKTQEQANISTITDVATQTAVQAATQNMTNTQTRKAVKAAILQQTQNIQDTKVKKVIITNIKTITDDAINRAVAIKTENITTVKPPHVIKLPDGQSVTEKEFKKVKGKVAWKQGIGYWIRWPEYRDPEDKAFSIEKPKGVLILPDAKSAFATIQAFGGLPPGKLPTMAMGFEDVYISGPPAQPSAESGYRAMQFKRNRKAVNRPKTNRTPSGQKVGPYYYKNGAVSRKPIG